MMQGKIGAKSLVGKGSEFYCYLPLAIQAELPANAKSTEPSGLILKGKNDPLVFVVEDNVLNQKVLCLMLEELGCRVVIADTGQKGLNLLSENLPDILCFCWGLFNSQP
mgnify:CR=1 FL=1